MYEIERIESLLSEEDKEALKKIYAPVIVGVQPEDSRRGICVMPDGEIRHYGGCDKKDFNDRGTPCYIASRDGGLSWKKHYAVPGSMGAAYRLPWRDRYITVVNHDTKGEDRGTWAYISDRSPDDTEFRKVRITEDVIGDLFQPKVFRSSHRIFCTGHRMTGMEYQPAFLYSDDDGEHWETRILESCPKYEPTYPSLDIRWENNGAEPVATEQPDGTLLLLARTSLNYLYAYTSSDGGNSWTDVPVPSGFHCTLTTPYFLELSDGRTLLFWNNTQPMPGFCQANQLPKREEGFHMIGCQDVFTNRDANHVAITTDFTDWKGFRELALNEIRNEPDFRCHGGILSSADKSVHQFQAIELPFGKVLVAYGQHEASRRIAIFDPAWLYETERKEDFREGLVHLSSQMYLRSWSGCALWTGHIGHCAWNRTNGALLVPDPEEDFREDLQLCRVHDERLVCEKQGVTWNFPMTKKGEVSFVLRREGAGVRVSLCDRWYNPTDTMPTEEAPFSFALSDDLLFRSKWYNVVFRFDTEKKSGDLFLNDCLIFHVNMRYVPDFGISYLHLQTLAEAEDFEGTLFRNLDMKSL